jgi:translation initiation factor 2B subunit (eIF-2B alpha/beta/delta family)
MKENAKIKETQEKIRRAKEAKERAQKDKEAKIARKKAIVDMTSSSFDSTVFITLHNYLNQGFTNPCLNIIK